MEYLRVVRLRRGKLNVSEFRLRRGERGLSVFASVDRPGSTEIVAAVRAAGKQGELAIAAIPAKAVDDLGLKVISAAGGTPAPDVNRLHAEFRVSSWRSFLLRLRGKGVDEYFNERFAVELLAAARLLERQV